MNKVTRRIFLGATGMFVAVAGAGGIWLWREHATAPVDRLLIDPETEAFFYRDGWIVRV